MSDETNNQPPRVQILNEAAAIIMGDRQKDYGPPSENFNRIAALWNVQFGKKLKEPLTAVDVSLAMIQVKMARMVESPTEDSFKDVGGYTGCGWELQIEEDEKPKPKPPFGTTMHIEQPTFDTGRF